MEVHPPEHPIHSARDFFLHLFTITIGLLIALGLEGLVEAAHHRHLLHQAENNLRLEFRENRKQLAFDEQQLHGTESLLADDLTLLTATRDHLPTSGRPRFNWDWNSMQSAAWDTARDTGALALMPYDRAQQYSAIYGQQTTVDDQAVSFFHKVSGITAPLQGDRKLSDLKAAEIDTMIANTQQAMVEAKLLGELCHGLDVLYDDAGSKL